MNLTNAFACAEMLLRLDEIELTRSTLGAIAAVAPDAARLHLFRGLLLLRDGKLDQSGALAAKHFRLSLGRDPLEPLAWHGLAAALPEGKEQLAAAERAERLSSSEGVADLRRGKPYLARGPLERLHADRPRDSEWALLLAECLRRLGDNDAARALLTPELDRVPVSAPAALLAAALTETDFILFERLREAAQSDPAWICARRLWAPDPPPVRLPVEPDVALPPAVAARVAEIGDPSTYAQSDAWRMSPATSPRITTPKSPHSGAWRDPGDVQGGSSSRYVAKGTGYGPSYTSAPKNVDLEVADVLAQVQRATQRLWGKEAQPLGQGDGVALLVTHEGSLRRRYGAATADEVIRRMVQLSTALADRGLHSELVIVDDPTSASIAQLPPPTDSAGTARAIKAILSATRRAIESHNQRLDAILLVGGDSVIPFHRLPNPSQDGDEAVLSDNPYGCDGGSETVPDVVVARLPDGGADGGELLLSLLQRSIDYHEGWLAPNGPGAGLALPLLRRFVDTSRTKGAVPAWGASTASWQEPSEYIVRALSGQRRLVFCPPSGPETLDGLADWSSSRIHFFNLHGLSGSPNWYGQAAGAAAEDTLPVAITPAQVPELDPATICLTEACYGAEITGRSEGDAMALRFLSRGALAVVGSTGTAYGSLSLPLGGADILAQQIFQNLRRGQPIGRALLLARDWMARETVEEQGYLDPDDAKTLLSFVLLGDPWASPYVKPAVQSKLALPAVEPVIAQRQTLEPATVSPSVMESVRNLMAKIVPELATVPLSAAGQGRPDRIAKGQVGTVVFSASAKVPTADGLRADQIARITVAHGTPKKFLLSR